MTTTRPHLDQQDRKSVDELLAAQQRRRDIAQLGAFAQHAKHDPRETTRGAFEARMRRYREQVDPTGELAQRDPLALAKRVESALKADMAKVRLARSKRVDDKRAALDRLRHTPSNHFQRLDTAATAVAVSVVETAMLGAELTTLEDLTERHARKSSQHNAAPSAPQNETAPVGTETVPQPHVSRKLAKFVSSDDGEGSVSHAPRRRQTSTPTHGKQQKKAAKRSDHHNTTAHLN